MSNEDFKATVMFCDEWQGREPDTDPAIYGSLTVSGDDPEKLEKIIMSGIIDAHVKEYPSDGLKVLDCMRMIAARNGQLGCKVTFNPQGVAHAIPSDWFYIVWKDDENEMLVHVLDKEGLFYENLMCRFDSDIALALACEMDDVDIYDEHFSSDLASHISERTYVTR